MAEEKAKKKFELGVEVLLDEKKDLIEGKKLA